MIETFEIRRQHKTMNFTVDISKCINY